MDATTLKILKVIGEIYMYVKELSKQLTGYYTVTIVLL